MSASEWKADIAFSIRNCQISSMYRLGFLGPLVACMVCCSSPEGKVGPSVRYDAKRCGGLPRYWGTIKDFQKPGDPAVANEIQLDANGQLRWNNEPILPMLLRQYAVDLGEAHALLELKFRVQDEADCDQVLSVRSMFERACRSLTQCFEFNEHEWNEIQPPPAP